MKYQSLHWTFGCLVLLLQCPKSGLALEANEIFKLVDPSVVVILAEGARRSDDMLGSGIIVEPLDVVTSCHVVGRAARLTVKQGSVQRSAKLRYQDAARDLCQIRLDDAFPSGKPVSGVVLSKELEVGQTVFAIGSPRGLEHTISRGMVSALREMKEEVGSLIQTDAPVSPGSSGGGLFDSQGRLIGIVTFQFKEAQNLNFAIPAEWLQELPKRNRDRLGDTTQVSANQGASDRRSSEPAPAGYPRIGDRWKYKLIDGRRTVGTVIVEVVDARGRSLKEKITREDEKSFLAERNVDADVNAARYQEVVSLPGGYQLAEFAPYVPGSQEIRTDQKWQGLALTLLLGGYGYGKQKFEVEARVVGQEKVSVPAGTFNTIHVQANSEKNLGSDRVRIVGDYWYSQESMRSVKMALTIKYSNPSFQPNIEVYELAAFESAK